MIEPTKVCTKCGVEYPATREWFTANKKGKCGLHSYCKKCICFLIKKWQTENPEKCNAASRKWYSKNNETQKARSKKWYSENPERQKALIKKWQTENPEKVQYIKTKRILKNQIGATPPPELVEIKVLINKTKKLCKTLNS